VAATVAPCTFGMEACSSAHHWGRWLASAVTRALDGREFVEPFRKSKGAKNDRNDAEAIVEAMSRRACARGGEGCDQQASSPGTACAQAGTRSVPR